VTRPLAATRSVDPTLAYVRDVDTPVVLADVVASLERLTELADDHDDPELANAARHVHALAVTLRAQFVSDLIGERAPAENARSADAEPSSRTDRDDAAGGPWMQAAR
jgi:hypothetical protein